MRDIRRRQKRFGEAIEYGTRYLAYCHKRPGTTPISLAINYVYLCDIYSQIGDTANTLV